MWFYAIRLDFILLVLFIGQNMYWFQLHIENQAQLVFFLIGIIILADVILLVLLKR